MRRSTAAVSPAINKTLHEVCLIKKREYPDDPKDLENLAGNLHKFDIYHIYEIGNTGATISEKAKPIPSPSPSLAPPPLTTYTSNNIAKGVPRPCRGKSYDYKKFMIDNDHYRCPFKSCLKEFSRPAYFREHLFTHDSDKPYKCDGCNKSFAMNKYCMRHSREHCPHSKFYTGTRKPKNLQKNVPLNRNESRQSNNDDSSMMDNDNDDVEDHTMGSIWDNSESLHDLMEQQQSYDKDASENDNGDDNDDESNDVNGDENNGTVDNDDDDDDEAVVNETEIEFVNPFDFL